MCKLCLRTASNGRHAMKYVGLFGGSFNPVHVGHIRLAIEALEYTDLPYTLDHVELIPCATPAHKDPHALLPFDLRYDMLAAACEPLQGLMVSAMEAELQGTSYTWHTLERYAQKFPEQQHLFMEGIENLLDLPYWYRGLELPLLADIGVVPRGDGDKELFMRTVKQHWPQATFHQSPCLTAHITLEGQERRVFYLPIPRLDISSSYLRERWLASKSLYGLMPEAAQEILEKMRPQAQQFWK